jgi:hypothetical protein
MPEDEAILKAFFYNFRGNADFFVLHVAPFSTTDRGRTKASWVGVAEYGTKSYPGVPDGLEKGDCVPLTLGDYRNHLNGGNGIAVSPLLNTEKERNVCFYGVIDIDVYDVNFAWLVSRLSFWGLRFSAFISKSGGLHIYFFLREAESADALVAALKRIVTVFGLNRLYVSKDKKSKVEIFPKQTAYKANDPSAKANCLFLPFYNAANPKECRQKLLTCGGKLAGIAKAIPEIEASYTAVEEINKTLDELPYGDAPYCIQMILLSGVLSEDSGRNNFLFACALYLKIKQKDGFEHELQKMNECLGAPLEDEDVTKIYESVLKRDYPLPACCKKSPCEDYCNRTLCREREYGVGREKDNRVLDVEFGKIIRVLTAKPYYIWEIRANVDDEYKRVILDDESNFLNQRVIQQACIKQLNAMHTTVKQQVWEEKVRECLGMIEQQAVSQATDTSELAALRDSFIRYLTCPQTRRPKPVFVKNGNVYFDGDTYYFSTYGLQDYLRVQNIVIGKINLREKLQDYGCEVGALSYTGAGGEERCIECMIRQNDAELDAARGTFEDILDGGEDVIKDIEVTDKETEVGDDKTRF